MYKANKISIWQNALMFRKVTDEYGPISKAICWNTIIDFLFHPIANLKYYMETK
jgi:hypothetical protein